LKLKTQPERTTKSQLGMNTEGSSKWRNHNYYPETRYSATLSVQSPEEAANSCATFNRLLHAQIAFKQLTG